MFIYFTKAKDSTPLQHTEYIIQYFHKNYKKKKGVLAYFSPFSQNLLFPFLKKRDLLDKTGEYAV